MARAKRVVFRFIAPKKPTDAAVLFYCRQLISPARQNLVRVCLMAHVPNQAIVRSVERVMQSNRKFHCSERCTRVPSDARHSFQNVLANFLGYVLKVIKPQPPQVFR